MKAPTSEPEQRSFEFGPFRLDPAARELLRDGSPVPLMPKSFDALLVLVQNSGRLLDKGFLLAEIWPDTHVEENNLAHAISDIRKALGEGPKDQRYVVTVPRRGYRFAARVETVEHVRAEMSAGISEPLDLSVDGTPEAEPRAKIVLPVVSGPPSVKEGPLRRRWLVYGVVGTALAIGVLVVTVIRISRPPQAAPLGNQDVLVLADFTNNTGEAIFDGTLREALAVQLERSPLLRVMGDAQIRRSLTLMGRSPDERVTNEIAREACVRERQKVVIHGSITSLGTSYALLLQATGCETGETLAREQFEARGREQVLTALGAAARGLRTKLGESLGSIQALERHPITEVTTPSLDAFQAFARGADLWRRGLLIQSVPLFQRAVELDPAFAMAYQQLGTAYAEAGERARAVEYSRKAYALVDRVSERERLLITAAYHIRVTGDGVKAAAGLQMFVQTFPRATIPRSWRGNFYMSNGEFERAAEDFEELVRLDPMSVIGRMNLMAAHMRLGHFDETYRVAHEAFSRKLDAPGLHGVLLEAALIRDDVKVVARETRWFEERDEHYESLRLRAMKALVLGQRRKAADLLRQASDAARRRNLHRLADSLRAAAAADPFGDCLVNDLLAGASRCPDLRAALREAENVSKERPADTLLLSVHLPARRAAVELHQGRPGQAIELLRSAVPFERRYVEVPYLRGLAHLRAGNGVSAAAEFRKITDHKGATWGPRYPLAYLGLARAAMQVGDTSAARKAYQDFFALWKDADPDVPILIAAKNEYAALN